VIGGQSLTWTSYGRYREGEFTSKKTDLKSGTEPFMVTSPLQIDKEVCPYRTTKQSYPGTASKDCFSFEAFDKSFMIGETRRISDGLSVTLQDATASYVTIDGRPSYEWTAQWKLDLNEEALKIATVNVPSTLLLHSDEGIHVRIESHLPTKALVVTAATFDQVAVGEKTTATRTDELSTGTNDLTIPVRTDILGETKVTIVGALQTEYGNIAFPSKTVTYTVMRDSASASNNQTTDENVEGEKTTLDKIAEVAREEHRTVLVVAGIIVVVIIGVIVPRKLGGKRR
jgi:hypothetical protein